MKPTTVMPQPQSCVQRFWEHPILLGTAALFLVAGPGGVCRADILDQSYPAPGAAAFVIGHSTGFVEQAQTFTVGTSGFLTGLNLQVSIFDKVPGTTTDNLMVSLWSTVEGAPDPDAQIINLGIPSVSVPTTGFRGQPAWVSVDLTDYNIPVTAGQMLAVVLGSTAVVNSNQGYFWLAGNNADGYPAGSGWGHTVGFSWHQDTFDFGFQDIVAPVPEPSVAAVSLLGLLCLAALRFVPRSRLNTVR